MEMKKGKRIAATLILLASIIYLGALGARDWENQKIVRIMDRYDTIDLVRVVRGQESSFNVEEPGQVQEIKKVCELRSLYAARNVKKGHFAALCEIQFYAQGALTGTARLYRVTDGSFMEPEKREEYETAEGDYYVLEWEKRWAFPVPEKDARVVLELLEVGRN